MMRASTYAAMALLGASSAGAACGADGGLPPPVATTGSGMATTATGGSDATGGGTSDGGGGRDAAGGNGGGDVIDDVEGCADAAGIDLDCAAVGSAWALYGEQIGCVTGQLPPSRAVLTVDRTAAPTVIALRLDADMETDVFDFTWDMPVTTAGLVDEHDGGFALEVGPPIVDGDLMAATWAEAELEFDEAPDDATLMAGTGTVVGEFEAEGGAFTFSMAGQGVTVSDTTAELEGCFRLPVTEEPPP